MNVYPLWKYLLVLAIVVAGVLYSLPNLYGEDPALQISSSRGTSVESDLLRRTEEALKAAGLPYKSLAVTEQNVMVRFGDTETQLKAQEIVRDALGNGYIVALNLAPATPAWLAAFNARPMYLGLDLRGGVHFLMEVDVNAAVAQAEERYSSEFRTILREAKARYLTVERAKAGERTGVEVKFRDPDARQAAHAQIAKQFPELQLEDYERDGDFFLFAYIGEKDRQELRRVALKQNITTLRNRVNELGVAEPIIQQQGENRIVVQLPGVQDTARAKEILGATATLEFRMVDEEHDPRQAEAGNVPAGSKLYYERGGGPILLRTRVMLTGDYIIDAASGLDQTTGGPAVFITLDSKGAGLFSRATKDNVGRLMAVVFIESKTETRQVNGRAVKTRQRVEEVINVARINEQLGKRFQITGLDSTNEARDLALLLRAGALAAPVEIVEERTVGPSQGQDNVEQGFMASLVGMILIIAFIIIYYRGFGFFSAAALIFNLVLTVAVLSMLQATLTLPGIAGIVLSIGMAVDANVLIFERIREELRAGNSPHASIVAGYHKAFGTIADSNITTVIAAIVLFGFGTGPIKGFAVTLTIGILTSMFTAIVGTRALVSLVYGGRRIKSLSI